MNCEYSRAITLKDTIDQLRDEIKILKLEVEILKAKLDRDNEIMADQEKIKRMFNPNHLWNADKTKLTLYCPNYEY